LCLCLDASVKQPKWNNTGNERRSHILEPKVNHVLPLHYTGEEVLMFSVVCVSYDDSFL
jgi:hypothetical protein